MRQRCLMLGSGSRPAARLLQTPDSTPDPLWTTLDINSSCRPDVVFNLEVLEQGHSLPFADRAFDEIHAYEVLEHFGRQGDYRGLFNTFRALWDVLKPGGFLIGTSPNYSSVWAWGDPGHTRIISRGTMAFLDRANVRDNLGTSPMTDYRLYVQPRWWEIIHSAEDGETYQFGLQKITEARLG